jgi:hypothetical protein
MESPIKEVMAVLPRSACARALFATATSSKAINANFEFIAISRLQRSKLACGLMRNKTG